jgi:hypothetical protein
MHLGLQDNFGEKFDGKDVKPRICTSHLLRLANPCCNACFTILFLNISMDMPASHNRSNCAFHCDLRRLATTPTAKSGLIRKRITPIMDIYLRTRNKVGLLIT